MTRSAGTTRVRWVLLAYTAIAPWLLGAARCQKTRAAEKRVAATASAIPDSANSVAYGLRMILTDQSVAKGLLLSDTAFTYDDGSRLELRRIHVTFYSSQGLKDGVMTSRSGVYNARLSRLEARGDVVVNRDDGKRLASAQLVYDQQRNQIFTDSAFVLTEPTRVFTGVGFESDPSMTNFRCLRACKGIAPVQIPVK